MSASAEILTAIAWPAAIVALLLVFRRPILDALRGLVEFNWGSASFKFERNLNRLAVSLAESEVPTASASVEGSALRDSLGSQDPRSAIIRGYLAIDNWAEENLPRHGIPSERNGRRRPLLEMIREAVEKGILPAPTISQVQGLQTLRNLAVHSPTDPTHEQAAEFLTLADAMLYVLQSAST